jgi:acyl carrier protein
MTEQDIRQWLINYLSGLLRVSPSEIDTAFTFREHGIESGMSLGLVADFEKWLEVELPLDVLFEHPTIDALACYVHQNYDSFCRASIERN